MTFILITLLWLVTVGITSIIAYDSGKADERSKEFHRE